MKRLRWYLLVAAMILAACAAGTAPNILHVQAGPGGLSSKKVEINDSWLARTLTFGEVSIRPTGSGSSMEAQVIIQNENSGDTNFEYRFLWYDASGFEISTVTGWIPAGLSGKESRGFISAAPGANAVSFKCMVRKMHAVTGS